MHDFVSSGIVHIHGVLIPPGYWPTSSLEVMWWTTSFSMTLN